MFINFPIIRQKNNLDYSPYSLANHCHNQALAITRIISIMSAEEHDKKKFGKQSWHKDFPETDPKNCCVIEYDCGAEQPKTYVVDLPFDAVLDLCNQAAEKLHFLHLDVITSEQNDLCRERQCERGLDLG